MNNFIKEDFHKIPYFDDYDNDELNDLVALSKVFYFKSGDIVMDCGVEPSKYTHILLEGKIALLQLITISRDPRGFNKIIDSGLTKEIERELELPAHNMNHLKSHTIQICSMGSGCVFNVGENVYDRIYVAAETNVKCILIPQYWIFSHDKFNTWSSLRKFFNSHLPSPQKTYKSYLANKKWQRFKKQICDDLLINRKCTNSNSTHNIPPNYRVRFLIPDAIRDQLKYSTSPGDL